MIDELVKVLDNVNNNGLTTLISAESEWLKLSEMTELNYNTNSCRLVANIITSDDHANAVTLCLYKDMFRMVRYTGIDPANNTCKDLKNTKIRIDIGSEEEFFQESTVEDFNGLVYDEYHVIQQIISVMTKHLWS